MMILYKNISKSKQWNILVQYSMWANDWNIFEMTKRRRNYLDWWNTPDFQRDDVLDDQDGYPLNHFLNKRAEEDKPYVRPLTNLRFKGHIFRKIYEDRKDEWNAASIPERQPILKEIIRTVHGSERVKTTGWEQINF